MKQCKGAGCYKRLDTFEGPVYPDYCPSCALKKRRFQRRMTTSEMPGKQHQLGIQGSGRWCRKGCCDLDNPQTGDCRV